MLRHLLTTVVLLVLPITAYAQFPNRGGFGGGFGGGPKPGGSLLPTISPFMPNISPVMPSISPVMPSISPVMTGGFGRNNRPNYNPGFWGINRGFYPYGYGYGYGYSSPVYYPIEVPVPVFVPVLPPDPPIQISGEAIATLVLQFPTPADVWLDGKKLAGDANDEWTLTSPPLATGDEFKFVVKAQWKVNGKTYEYERSFEVAAGHRSKALVVSGTEIKE